MTEEQIINDQFAHHQVREHLLSALDYMTPQRMVQQDHHIERLITHVIKLIEDKDKRLTS